MKGRDAEKELKKEEEVKSERGWFFVMLAGLVVRLFSRGLFRVLYY